MNAYYSTMDSPVGMLRLEGDGRALTRLVIDDRDDDRDRPESVRDDALFDAARRQLTAYFAGERHAFDLVLAPRGSVFQNRVWRALRAMAFGETASYADIARRIHAPKTARAVGWANGRNPIPIIIPCHRVIGSDGRLTGYRGGLARKRWLLTHESDARGSARAAQTAARARANETASARAN